MSVAGFGVAQQYFRAVWKFVEHVRNEHQLKRIENVNTTLVNNVIEHS